MHRVAWFFAPILACGGLDAKEAKELFETANSTIHRMHINWLANMPAPPTYEYACTSGTIDLVLMETADRRDVAHQFRACEVDDLRISGSFDYLGVERCEPSGIDIDIVGVLEVEGRISGKCEVNVHEDCTGTFTGDVCGTDPRDFVSADI